LDGPSRDLEEIAHPPQIVSPRGRHRSCYTWSEEALIGFVLFGAVLFAAGWIVLGIFTHLRRNERTAIEMRARTEAALEAPGALPGHPIEVTSAAAVEPRAEAEACRICGGRLHTRSHEAVHTGGAALRSVRLRCGACGRDNQLFFRLRDPPS
jgi:hypothetical protein